MYKLDLRVKNAICDSFSLPGLVQNFTVKSDMTVIGQLPDKEFFVQKGNTRTKVESDTMPLLLPSKKLVTTSKETIKIGQKTLTLDSEILLTCEVVPRDLVCLALGSNSIAIVSSTLNLIVC